ncbi:hypothetical protein ACP8HI_22035 [Paenibacillus sp. FA6]|uniref:hypothetical protein n=1 Tax=Paenibacillus sp. FA6 TaxID=3413029 RepID=UPI003F65F3C8
MKKLSIIVFTLLLTMAVVLTGCGSKQSPKEALQNAAGNTAKMTSYEMKSKVIIEDLKFNAPELVDDASVGMVMTMLKNAELTVDGYYQADPMQTELTVGLNLKGDMAMSFTIPMVVTKEKVFIKIPSIPMLPLPESIVNKYLELDLKELAEQSGTELNLDTLDTEKSQKLASEISDVVFKEYEEAKYFKDIAVKDANLPEGVEAKQVVQFQVTNDNVEEAIKILVNKALPNIISVIDKDEYRELLGLKAEDVKELKDELASLDEAEFNQGLEEMKKYLKINTFNLNTAINKKDFTTYQDIVMDIEVNDPETNQEMKLALKGYNQYLNINEKQTFKIGIPSGDEVITMEQFQKEFGGGF